MAYVKNTWRDQEVERPKTYEMTNNPDGSVTLIDSFGIVTELGTPVNADNMNHIEDGIAEHEDRITLLEEGADTSNYVQKSGDTMTGTLRLENHDVQIVRTDFDYTSTEIPSESQGLGSLITFDKNGKAVTGFNTYVQSGDGRIMSRIYARRSVDGAEKQCDIRATVLPDGSLETFAPTPASGDNSTKIATTQFVKSVLSSSGNGLATVKKGANGYIKFNNGIIIQWGRVASFSGEKTVTLPIAFTSTNYTVVSGMYIQGDWTANWGTYTYTTTTFIIQNQSSGSKTMNWIAIGY